MAQRSAVWRHIGLDREGAVCVEQASDGELLRGFLRRRDEAAFAALVRRHGPMVVGVCRRVLRNAQDIEDAFQATFLVLVQRATAMEEREILGDWLHGVAYHTALKARAMTTRRQQKEAGAAKPETAAQRHPNAWLDVVDEEVRRLPARYRTLLVLCDLRQKTRREAARELQMPPGTVASGLARAREMLAKRMRARGYELSGVLVGTMLTEAAGAQTMPERLLPSTVSAASQLAAGVTPTAVVSTKVVALMKASLGTLLTHKVTLVVLSLTVGVGLACGLVAGFGNGGADPHEIAQAKVPSVTQPLKQVTQNERRPVAGAHAPARRMKVQGVPVELAKKWQGLPPGSDEEAISLLNLTKDQYEQYQCLRTKQDEETKKLYRMKTGFVERGAELNRWWTTSLKAVFTADQYRKYCEYWDSRSPVFVAHVVE
jgi:RNA polymerase sigma factor (sigma-70 family)